VRIGSELAERNEEKDGAIADGAAPHLGMRPDPPENLLIMAHWLVIRAKDSGNSRDSMHRAQFLLAQMAAKE
jgi:hypothetical protein